MNVILYLSLSIFLFDEGGNISIIK